MIRISLCQRNKSQKIMTWYVRIFDTDSGKIRYESLGTAKKSEAFERLAELKSSGKFDRKDEKDVTFKDAFDAYLKHLETRGASHHSIVHASFVLGTMKSVWPLSIRTVDKKTILEAFNESRGGKKASSYNNERTVLKTALKYAMDLYDMDIRNPAEIIKTRKAQQVERDFWTPEQVDRILDNAPNPMYRLVWAMMAFAGLRIHEALKATPEDFRDGYLYVTGKGNKAAKIPVSSRLEKELSMVGFKWDFFGVDRRPDRLKKAAKRAIPDGFQGEATNHRFRHSFASNLIRAGANIKAVQMLMRHSSIQITLNIYSHLLNRDLKTEIEKMFGNY